MVGVNSSGSASSMSEVQQEEERGGSAEEESDGMNSMELAEISSRSRHQTERQSKDSIRSSTSASGGEEVNGSKEKQENQEPPATAGTAAGGLTGLLLKSYYEMLGEKYVDDKSPPLNGFTKGDDPQVDTEEEDVEVDFSQPDPYALKHPSNLEEDENVPLDKNPERLRGLIKKLNALSEEEEDEATQEDNKENGEGEHRGNDQTGSEQEDERKEVENEDLLMNATTVLCDLIIIAKGESDPRWDFLRQRLKSLSRDKPEALQTAAEMEQGKHYFTTPLHLACRRRPPLDIIQSLVRASPRVLAWSDRNTTHPRWLPLHCAVEYRASSAVIQYLVKRYPQARLAQTAAGLTPLHLACSFHRFNDGPPSPDVVDILSNDDDGQAVRALNNDELTPLDVFLRSVGFVRRGSDRTSQGKSNTTTDDIKSTMTNTMSTRQEYDSYVQTMKLLVRRTPPGSGKYIKSLRIAPTWLWDETLRLPEMQRFLNDRMKDALAIALLMGDFYAHLSLIVLFTIVANWTARDRFGDDGNDGSNIEGFYYLLFVPNAYLILRDLIHFLTEGMLWYSSAWNWLDAMHDVMILVSTLIMTTERGANIDNENAVRLVLVATGGLTWLMGLVFLKSTYLPFSVFISGVLNIFKSLVPFILSVVLVMGAFAHMYYINTEGTASCDDSLDREGSAFCTYGGSWLQVYSILVGGIADFMFTNAGVQDQPGVIEQYYNRGTMVLSIVYAFLVAMLLRSILIAIVNDAWTHVRKRGEVVFWSHRFTFVAEVDRIRVKSEDFFTFLVCNRCGSREKEVDDDRSDRWELLWDLITLTYSNHYDGSVVWEEIDKFEKLHVVWFLCGYKDRRDWKKVEASLWFRRICFFFVASVWIVAGAVTFGQLWPEAVRTFLFCPEVKDDSNPEVHKHEKDSNKTIDDQDQIKAMEEKIMKEMASIMNELNSIKKQLA